MIEEEAPARPDSTQREPAGATTDWADALQGAVQAMVAAVNDSSRQLADAAGRFSEELVRATESAAARTEQAARESAEASRAAAAAAEEARSLTAGLPARVTEATEAIEARSSSALAEIESRRADFAGLAEQLSNELRQRVGEVIGQLDSEAEQRKQALDTALDASARTQTLADRTAETAGAIEAALEAARQAAVQARTAADQATRSESTIHIALANAREAAEASQRSASVVERAEKQVVFQEQGAALLERLETDYALLARLIEDLQRRIANLPSVGALAAAAPKDAQPPTPRANLTVVSPLGTDANGALGNDAHTEHHGLSVVAAADDDTRLSGRVSVTIGPVQSFDRLHNLDDALSRLDGVRQVTLADYAGEEVTFRVDMDSPVSAADLASRLAEVVGLPAQVVSASPETLALRVS